MTEDIAIRVNGLGRDFGPPFGLRGAPDGITVRGLLRLFGFNVRAAGPDQIQVDSVAVTRALRDISLEIERGSVVCLDGGTGAGKSTLLKALAGVIVPTHGSAELHGLVSALLRIGDNLDRGLTGLENIEEQRQLRAIPDADAAVFAREVIEFAELTEAKDALVRTYSSGMALRLSVALAVHGTPDILLVDDVLGVGDISFQHKFVDRLRALKDAGCTMLLALSDDSLVRELATRVITLEAGAIVADSPSSAAPPRADNGAENTGAGEVVWRVADEFPANEVAALRHIDVRSANTDRTSIDVHVQYHVKTAPQRCRPLVDLMVGKTAVFRSVFPTFIDVEMPGQVSLSLEVPTQLVAEGRYRLEFSLVSIVGPSIYSLKSREAVTIDVGRSHSAKSSQAPLIRAVLPWEVEAFSD